jgi:hypothetical protein
VTPDLTTATGREWARLIREARAADKPAPTSTTRPPAHVTGQPNKTEAAFARRLEGQKAAGLIRDYWFEPMKLRLDNPDFGRRCWFTVDYLIVNNDGSFTFAEVKGGHIWEDGLIKWKWAAERFASWGRWEMWQRRKGEFTLIHSRNGVPQ